MVGCRCRCRSAHYSYFELKGEYINTWVETNDRGTLSPRGWWIQGGYKLVGLNLNLPFINNNHSNNTLSFNGVTATLRHL
jgi:hypothetical protein